ncbi:phosphoribosyltransferase [Fundicoccus culcitae]|uniref:Phosphoribosyltransferase family protein n=1 Tax=Fundicoccus culcitae TaxID=2969821 RepID=A0ABY5P4Y6_9LACT|nr:phosphoribosyltransferase family protein [Fundicoccus culcitae]UUX33771.1 phosphoribosyltransferase family protein [Fundicoccus culcitae]
MLFKDRMDAGKQLARKIPTTQTNDTIVLALPRGGVPLAVEIVKYLHCDFDVILAKKIGHPRNSEYAIGAIAEGGQPIYNQHEVAMIDKAWLAEKITQIQAEMARRRRLYDTILTAKDLKDRSVIIVDDGIATGMTMFAAIEAARVAGVSHLAVAVPVIPKDTYEQLQRAADAVYYLQVPNRFLGAVGAYYQSFPQVMDFEVQELIKSLG